MQVYSILNDKQKLSFRLQIISSLAVLSLVSVFLMLYMKSYGYYASGNDIWGHLFKSDFMYKNILNSNPYPLYTDLWYNGLQPYRYWAPLPYYLMAMLQYLAGGSIVNAYYYFAGFTFFFGGLGWLLWGISCKRVYLGTFLGVIWFFMPENFRVFFCEGNMPRIVTAVIIPYLVYFIWIFVEKRKNAAIFPVIILMSLMVLSHVMLAAMMGIGAFIFFFFYAINIKNIQRPIYTLIAMVLSFSLCGIWLYPALKGGLIGMEASASAEVMKSLTYSLDISLNPFNRLYGNIDTFYYGLSVVLVSILGILLSNRKEKAGFYTAIIILLTTTTSAVAILSKLPLNQLLWMMRFASIAYAFFFLSLLTWEKCKHYFMIILMIIILIDCIPSFSISRYYIQVKDIINEEISIAKQITKQRIALIDLSTYASYPSWELCQGDTPTKYTYGWAWQGAATASNIVMLNTAMERGYFDYMFDRCVELGNDTVIVRKDLLKKSNKTAQALEEAAAKSQYDLYKETRETYIFHRNTSASFGVITDYQGIAIGKSASQIVLLYPEFTVGNSSNLEDYTVEELARYHVVYLSDFEFRDRISAEDMVTQLGSKGVKVVIDMNRIPADKKTNRMTFLGVTASEISFDTMFPTLNYNGKDVVPRDFVEDFSTWNTVYLDNVSNPIGKFSYEGEDLAFMGSNQDENIVFIGCNIIYHASEAEDRAVLDIISDVFQFDTYVLPPRELIDINITYEGNKIIIDTPTEGVNTTIAYQDCFKQTSGIINENNLLATTQKHTEIQLVYPYLIYGILTTIAGLSGLAVLLVIIFRKSNKN